jgi:hypothetical protein
MKASQLPNGRFINDGGGTGIKNLSVMYFDNGYKADVIECCQDYEPVKPMLEDRVLEAAKNPEHKKVLEKVFPELFPQKVKCSYI